MGHMSGVQDPLFQGGVLLLVEAESLRDVLDVDRSLQSAQSSSAKLPSTRPNTSIAPMNSPTETSKDDREHSEVPVLAVGRYRDRVVARRDGAVDEALEGEDDRHQGVEEVDPQDAVVVKLGAHRREHVHDGSAEKQCHEDHFDQVLDVSQVHRHSREEHRQRAGEDDVAQKGEEHHGEEISSPG